YAVRSADLAAAGPGAPVPLPVLQRIPAGHPAGPLPAGGAARIFTGALIPVGADAVVMQEDAVADTVANTVAFVRRPAEGLWIRRRGEDIRVGQVILDVGTRLGAQQLGLAASIGAGTLPVTRRPRVAIFSTGDELAMPGEVAIEDLKPGALFNSNRFTLRALIEALGCEVVDLGIVPDTLAATRDALVRAASQSDCIVTSGGVSVGEEDHMRPAVAAEGSIAFWQIALKPGKPLAFGRVRDALFVGLPGNPVSGFVTFLMFVRPLLMRLQGIADVAPRAYRLRADFDWPRPDQRQEYLRVRSNADGGLDLFPHQGSAVLTSTVWADGLLENPPGCAIVRGDLVRFLPFAALIG
ncbi:MAG: gephyrin-like molybdotransferase Glp, partial [Burkholderiaceae bacterium]